MREIRETGSEGHKLYIARFWFLAHRKVLGHFTPDIIVHCFPLVLHPTEGGIGVVILMHRLPTREGEILPNLHTWWSAGFASFQLSFSFWLLSMWWCGLVCLETSERFFFFALFVKPITFLPYLYFSFCPYGFTLTDFIMSALTCKQTSHVCYIVKSKIHCTVVETGLACGRKRYQCPDWKEFWNFIKMFSGATFKIFIWNTWDFVTLLLLCFTCFKSKKANFAWLQLMNFCIIRKIDEFFLHGF